MSSLRDPSEAARVYGPAKFAAWLTIGIMAMTIIYAVFMGIILWPEIGV